MRQLNLLVAPIALAAMPTSLMAAECVPEFASADQSVVVSGVEIAPGAMSVDNFQVRIRKSGGGDSNPGHGNVGNPCPATIRVSRLTGPVDPNFPEYNLRAPGQSQVEILQDPSAGGTSLSDVKIANAPVGPQGRSVPFELQVPTEWGLTAGTYIDRLELLLFDQNGALVDRTNLTITILIPATVSVRFVGAVIGGGFGSGARIDLGTLSTSEQTRSQPFGARIFSTAPYLVNVASANSGNLAHVELGSEIPYRLYFDGAQVDLSGISAFTYLAPTPRSGNTRPMSLEVPPASVPAGRYNDRITLTVSAL